MAGLYSAYQQLQSVGSESKTKVPNVRRHTAVCSIQLHFSVQVAQVSAFYVETYLTYVRYMVVKN
jgi:hypothetical protein